jgi:thiamine-monophosphate kinase
MIEYRMPISKIGEFGLIERFQRLIKTDASVIKGSGDDCAVLKFSRDKYQLFSCDMICEDIDFSLRDDPGLIGRKAVAVSISDIASCGGIPRHCLVSLGLPKKTRVAFINRLFKGMLDITRKYKINLVGGDLSSSLKVTIDVSMIGEVEKKNLVLRSGAKNGDIIFVTGDLGGSIRSKHLRFTPRLKEARALVRNYKLNAMIDISDGLIQDLGHILSQSRLGAVIYQDLIPQSHAARSFSEALYMGEDFELLFTASRSQAKKIINRNYPFCIPIGEIMDRKYGLKLIDRFNRQRSLEKKGFCHF